MKGNGHPEKEITVNQNSPRQSEIYQKALDLFIKKGYDTTPMSMIAGVLGMSKANLYYYCSNKENLLYQIHLNDLRRRFIPILEEAVRLPDPEDRIVFFLRSFAIMCTSRRVTSLHRRRKKVWDEVEDKGRKLF